MMKVALLLAMVFLATNANASLFKCTEWTNARLDHQGDLAIAVSGEQLVWKADNATSIAQEVKRSVTHAVYIDEAFVYMAFGYFSLDRSAPVNINFVRRIPIQAQSWELFVGETRCE